MVYNCTSRYYRSKVSVYPVSSKRTILPLRKPKPKQSPYSKNPELNEWLKIIFHSSTFEEDVSLSRQPIINFLVFEYSSYDGKLTLSLSMKGQMINIIEVLEEKEVIKTFKTLSRKKIPCWVENIYDGFKPCFPCDVCLSNISVTDGVNTNSVFCLLLKPLSTKKAITDLDLRANGVGSQVQNPVESHPVPIQSQDSSNHSQCLAPNQGSGPISVQEEMTVNLHPQDDQEKVLETNFKNFLKIRQVTNEAFLFHCDKDGKFVSSIYSVFAEDGKSSIYLIKEVSHLEKNLMYLKDVEKSQISHLKIKEFQEDNREHLNDYIFLLLKEVISGSTYFNLQYTRFSLEEIQIIDIMEMNVVYMDGKKYEYLNGNKYEFPFDREYFQSKEIARIGDVSLTWNSLFTLSPRMWLNDIIIDSYLNLIAERSKMFFYALPSVYVFNTYFLKRLQLNRVQPEKFSDAQDILQADMLFMPVNISDIHWALYCVDNRHRTILYYDSLQYARPNLLVLIENFLNKVAERHPHWARGPLPLAYFKSKGDAIKQDNGYDCGVFLLKHADYLSRNQLFNFSQKDMPQFREQVMQEIFHQKLFNEKSQSPNGLYPIRRICDTSLTLNSLHSLSMPGWLDEKVVNAYLNLIALRSKQYSYIFPLVFVFNTSFLPALLCEKVQLGKYTAADILKFEMLFIPFRLYQKHWTLFCVNNRTRTLLCYDSWRSSDCECLRLMNSIEKFLREVAAVLDLKPLQYCKGFGEAAKLDKSEDCGVFLLMHAEYLSRKEKFNFSENEMLDIRTQVLYELCIQKLSSPLPDICPPGFPEIPSNIEVGCTNDKYQTLNFNIAVGDIVIESYMDFLKKRPSVWVYPDLPDESKNTLLFPFRNKRSWALIVIDRCTKVLKYFNIPTTGDIDDELRLINLFYRYLEISDFTRVELSFSEHVVDSGVYVLAISYCMVEGIPISFDDRHVAYLRKKIYWDLKSESVEVSENQGSRK